MKKFRVPLIIGLVVLSLILLFIFSFQGVGNKAINIEEQIQVADSDIKVQEKRRIDLIYNLVDVVKEYDKHEYNTLKDVVDSRGKDTTINEVTTMINATAEAYPELKSDTNYKQLMNELSITENLIAQHRSNYNKQLKEYNRYIRKFPNRIILNVIGYEIIDYQYLDYNAPQDAPQNLFEGR